MPLQIVRNDITMMATDAIVNPSNTDLRPGGGVDVAIHKAAGRRLTEACRQIGGIGVGQAVVTPAYSLPCKYVIHTAGPVWQGGDNGEREALISCYQNALALAKKQGCESVAVPLISSGAYGYPKDRVLQEAIRAISDFLLKNEMTVFLVVFDKDSYAISSKLFEGIDSFIDDNYVRQHTEDRCFGASVCASRRLAPSPCAMVEDTLALPDIGEHIKLDESFSVKLLKLIDAKGMEDVACYKKANVSKQTWYKILSDPHYKPSKKTVISFAVALGLTLTETQNLLSSVGFALSDSNLFDVIIKYCLTHNVYDVHDIDTVLFHYDQETLFSKG